MKSMLISAERDHLRHGPRDDGTNHEHSLVERILMVAENKAVKL